jgi:RNA polymerase sigma-70 factor (ECF subfamily)
MTAKGTAYGLSLPRPRLVHYAAMVADDVTGLLREWNRGDKAALDRLMPLVAGELRKVAGAYLRRERAGHTLQPTALINEVYLKMVDRQKVDWRDRAHFFAFAACTMRRILVDHARVHRAGKRGAALTVSIEAAGDLVSAPRDIDLLALDEALDALTALDTRQARLVELRFFVGLTIEETAEVLDVATATVSRDWLTAKAWLFRRLRPGSTSSPRSEA